MKAIRKHCAVIGVFSILMLAVAGASGLMIYQTATDSPYLAASSSAP